MCLITTQQEPFTATEDMVVYKMFQHNIDGLFAPYFPSFKYERDKVYESEIKEIEDGMCWTCADQEDNNWLNANYPKWWPTGCEGLTCFASGFHFATSRQRLSAININNYLIKKCVVPKGAIYYLDATGLGVANKIINPSEK